jgi:multidrug resistance efflux pump
VETLDHEGLIDRGSLESAQHEVDSAERAFLALEDQLAQTEIELGRLLRERDSDAARRAQELAEAEAKVEAARIWVGETFVTAPRAGQVEGLSVHTGQLVQTGTLLARIVPGGTQSSLVAFLPERDRAFLREGAEVKLDVDRLPVGEFGSLAARVTRISQDIAHPEELATALGAAAPEGVWFRVALELSEDERMTRLAPYLRSGTLVTVRAPLRTRRIIALLFDPIRRWLE